MTQAGTSSDDPNSQGSNNSPNHSTNNLSSNRSHGVLPDQEGVILQRGGEELRLNKIRDRLTLCVSDLAVLQSLTLQWQPRQTRNVTPQGMQQSPVTVEWKLPAHR